MNGQLIDDITARFEALAAVVPLHTIRTEDDYNKAVDSLNQLLDAGAADGRSTLADLANALGSFIGNYEDQHYPPEKVPPASILRFLMEQHDLSQSDLPEVGSQGVVSEVLRGKRELNVRQIRALSKRFKVSPLLFI